MLLHNAHVSYCSVDTSDVQYLRYLDTYCWYLCDDTSIAKVTI